MIFQALKESHAARLLTGQFAACVYVAVVIFSYESFRQKSFLARRGQIFLLLSQLATAAGCFPMYCAVVAYSRSAATMARRPTAPQVWSVLLSSILGFLVPTYYMGKQGWSYDALSLWQIYPVYVIILNAILPTLLKPIFKKTSPSIPIYIILALSIYLSARAHFEMLTSGVDFRDVMLIFKQPQNLTTDAHRLFLFDFITSTLALMCFVVLTFDSASGEHKFGYFWVLMTITNIVGPSGALAVVWTIREIIGTSSLQAQIARSSGAKKAVKQL
jgi:hypothetical protein